MPLTFVPVPERMCCPITLEIMVEPVFTSDGETYEKSAIENWLENNNNSPKTNQVLDHKLLTSNRAMKSDISQFVSNNLDAFKEDLIASSKENDIKTVELILKLGVSANVIDQNGFSLAHYASINNNVELLRLLNKYNSNINQKTATFTFEKPDTKQAIVEKIKQLETQKDSLNQESKIFLAAQQLEELKSFEIYLLNAKKNTPNPDWEGKLTEMDKSVVHLQNMVSSLEKEIEKLRGQSWYLDDNVSKYSNNCERIFGTYFRSASGYLHPTNDEQRRAKSEYEDAIYNRDNHPNTKSIERKRLENRDYSEKMQNLKKNIWGVQAVRRKVNELSELFAVYKKETEDKVVSLCFNLLNFDHFGDNHGLTLFENIKPLLPTFSQEYFLKIQKDIDRVNREISHFKELLKRLETAIFSELTPCAFAALHGHEEALNFLLEQGVGVNDVADNQGSTLAHWAARGNSTTVLQHLINKRSATDLADHQKQTPLDIANDFSHTEIVELLNRPKVHEANIDPDMKELIMSMQSKILLLEKELKELKSTDPNKNKAQNNVSAPSFFDQPPLKKPLDSQQIQKKY